MRFDMLPCRPMQETFSDACGGGADIADCAFVDDSARQDLFGLDITRCRFSGCRLSECDFTRTTMTDVLFERCDLSGTIFRDAGLHRVTFRDCRALGARFDGALWDHVTVQDGTFNYVNLIRAEWRHCTLSAAFRDAALSELTVRETDVTGCDFSRADWSRARIAGLDLTAAQIEGAVFSVDGLGGVIVSQMQAAELARLLGLVIHN